VNKKGNHYAALTNALVGSVIKLQAAIIKRDHLWYVHTGKRGRIKCKALSKYNCNPVLKVTKFHVREGYPCWRHLHKSFPKLQYLPSQHLSADTELKCTKAQKISFSSCEKFNKAQLI